jgi:hypothetical protein
MKKQKMTDSTSNAEDTSPTPLKPVKAWKKRNEIRYD